ncbi:MAG TPA: TM0106 family RecB-like putative nuclease [Arthrobacter sp.]
MFFLPAVSDDSSDLVLSAGDIVAAAGCEYGAMRSLDVLLGRVEARASEPDEMLELVSAMGAAHEAAVLEKLRPKGVHELAHTGSLTRGTLTARHAETLSALAGGHGVVYQASFFDGTFHGRADFLVREPDGTWSVNDTKLSRTPKDAALLQLAAYADQLEEAGVPVHPEVRLILGTGETTRHSLAEILPRYRGARNRLEALASEHRDEEEPAAWGDARWSVCLHCAPCKEAIEANDDLMLVRLMNTSRRSRLIAMGISTMTAFARADLPKADNFLRTLQEQAKLQTGTAATDGEVNGTSYQVLPGNTLGLLPAPSAGDIFFDFEGDPLYQDSTADWGLEYLFGLLEHEPAGATTEATGDAGEGTVFTGYTAHDRAQEKTALIDFITHVQDRRARFPDLHVYHYASYEVTALRRLAARHGVMAAEVEELVEAGVLFDLFVTVKTSLRISERSLSIKKLEPLYMPAARTGTATAVDSITAYSKYRAAALTGDTAAAAALFEDIRAYNEYDCLSTLRLRDWLLTLPQ